MQVSKIKQSSGLESRWPIREPRNIYREECVFKARLPRSLYRFLHLLPRIGCTETEEYPGICDRLLRVGGCGVGVGGMRRLW